MKNFTTLSEQYELVMVSPDLCIFLEALDQLSKEDKIIAMLFICRLLTEVKEKSEKTYQQ